MGVVPKLFKIVIGAPVARKKMDDNTPQVNQHPATFGFTFGASGPNPAFLTGSFDYGVCQRPDLPVIVSVTEDKVV